MKHQVTVVAQIVEEYLKRNGFDGLYNFFEPCGCKLGDLMPCSDDCSACKPGYKVDCTEKCSEEHDGFGVGGWHIQAEKP